MSWITYKHLLYAPCLAYWTLFHSLCQQCVIVHHVCAQVHEYMSCHKAIVVISGRTYIYIYIYHRRVLRSSHRKLVSVGFEPTTTKFCSDAVTDWAIRPWAELTLTANFVQLLQFYLLFSVRFHFGFSKTAQYDGNRAQSLNSF